MTTFTGRWPAEDVDPSWLSEWFLMTPGARPATYFSVRRGPWLAAPVQEEHEQRVLSVVGFLPELYGAVQHTGAVRATKVERL